MPKALIVNDSLAHNKKFFLYFLARIIFLCEDELLKWELIWRIYLTEAIGLQLEDLDQSK